MPEPNTRLVVIGAPRADKEFTVFASTRKDAEKIADAMAKSSERLAADIKRLARLKGPSR